MQNNRFTPQNRYFCENVCQFDKSEVQSNNESTNNEYTINETQMSQTASQYQQIIQHCRALFLKKHRDYGSAWRILRLPSITDQIFIKAQRIRSIQEKGVQKVEDGIVGEFIGIVNYCIIALIQSELGDLKVMNFSEEEISQLYDKHAEETQQLLQNKNHDYDEAWRDMRVSSMTDIILMKIFRTKQIEDNAGKTLVSEGIEANYHDMINYSVFCLIKLQENQGGNEQ